MGGGGNPPAADPIIAAIAAGLNMAYGFGIIAGGGHIMAGFGGAWLEVEPLAAAAAAAK